MSLWKIRPHITNKRVILIYFVIFKLNHMVWRLRGPVQCEMVLMSTQSMFKMIDGCYVIQLIEPQEKWG